VLVVGEHADVDAEARIQRVLDAPNGYALTEARVQLRGVEACVVPGCAPLPQPRILDWDGDRELLLAARDEAHRMLRADPNLRRGSHQELAAELRGAWDALWPDNPEWRCPFTEEGTSERRRRRRRRRRK
jgi:RecG-like helicase